MPFPLSFTLTTKESSKPVFGSVRVRNAWCGRFAVPPSTVLRTSFNVSAGPSDTGFPRSVEGLSLKRLRQRLVHGMDMELRFGAYLALEPPPTPAPLLATDTVASSKLHEEAADTIAALESNSEETKPSKTLIVADPKRVNAQLAMMRGDRRKRVLCQDSRRHFPARRLMSIASTRRPKNYLRPLFCDLCALTRIKLLEHFSFILTVVSLTLGGNLLITLNLCIVALSIATSVNVFERTTDISYYLHFFCTHDHLHVG